MRTVDPVLWSKTFTKPGLNLSRPSKFGFNEVSRLESRLRTSFRDALKEFWRNSTVERLGLRTDTSSQKIIRVIYSILFCITMICGLIVFVWNIQYFWNLPHLMVTVQYNGNPLEKIHFPAVAICSYNRISRSALNKYAQYLYSLDKNSVFNKTEIKKNLLAFSALHIRDFLPHDFNFHSHLEKVAHETNVTNILYKLSPKCESMLVRCSWQSQRISCGRLFATRITDLGFCCIFNSRYFFIDRNNKPKSTGIVGRDAGLSVVVRENSDDFTSARRPGDSVEVLIFDGEQYPLIRTGVVRSYAAARNASVLLRINTHVQEAAYNLRYVSDEWLGCHMRREVESASHSWSWCVGTCRAQAVLALCRCAPHTLPPLTGAPACSLEHLACLAKHKEKLSFLYPGDSVHESLSEEQEDSVDCEHCRLGCERRRYWADVATIPHSGTFFLNRFFKGVDLTNTTIISIYYKTEDQHLFLVEAGMRWYEAFAIMSSQLVFVLGATVAGALELLYHCTIRWRHHYMHRGSQIIAKYNKV